MGRGRFPEERSVLTYTKTPDSNVAEIVVDGKITDEEILKILEQPLSKNKGKKKKKTTTTEA